MAPKTATGYQKNSDTQFQRALGLLDEYILVHGHSNIPARENFYDHTTATTFHLGKWLARAKDQARNGTLEPQRLEALKKRGVLVPASKTNHAMWGFYVDEARLFEKKHHHPYVPLDYVSPSGVTLGNWIAQQILLWKNKKLTQQQVKFLADRNIIWAWEQDYEPRNQKLVRNAKVFATINGHLNPPQWFITPEGYRLGSVIHDARKQLKNAVSTPTLTALQDIGLTPIAVTRAERRALSAAHGVATVDAVNALKPKIADSVRHSLLLRSIEPLPSVQTTGDEILHDETVFFEVLEMWVYPYVKKFGHANIQPGEKFQRTRGSFALGDWMQEQVHKFWRGGLTARQVAALSALVNLDTPPPAIVRERLPQRLL